MYVFICRHSHRAPYRNMSRFLREKIEEEYSSVMGRLPLPREVFSLDRFLWAYAVLLSRSFRLRFGPKEVIALVPWIDFMNHDPDSKAVRVIKRL